MKFANKTLEYYANIDTMREMEQYIPMTRSERDLFYAWVASISAFRRTR